MVESIPTPVLIRVNFPSKPYILRLRMNLLREISSFLQSTDFIEFCLSCRDFLKLIDDKFISKKISVPKPVIPFKTSRIDLIHDYNSLNLMSRSRYPSVNVEWKTSPIRFFHYCMFDTTKLVFLLQDHSIDIKEVKNFSFDLSPVYSKVFPEKILKAVGFKNKILLMFSNRVELVELDQTTVFQNELNDQNKSFSYEISKEFPKTVKFLNNGRSCLLVTKKAVHLLNSKMVLLLKHEQNVKFEVLVPNTQGKNYLIYNVNEILVFKVGCSQEKRFKVDFMVWRVRTSHFLNAPQLIISSLDGEMHLGTKKLDIRTEGKFWVYEEFVVYTNYLSRSAVTVYNLALHQELYKLPNIYCNNSLRNAFITSFKLIFLVNEQLVLEDMNQRIRVNLNLNLETITKIEFINNMLIISGTLEGHFGVFILDMSRNIDYSDYIKAFRLPEA